MTLPTESATAAVNTAKIVVVLDHLKNNRIEYLVLVLFSHVLGLTSKAMDHASGVCA